MECTLSADNQLGPRVLPACREFDFTLLFEQWILAFLPDIVFLILCLLRCYQIHADSRKVRRHFTGTWKIVLITLLFLLKLSLLVLWSLPHAPKTAASIPSATVSLASTAALLLLSLFEHSRSLRPSTLICLYLLITTLFDTAQTRTLWLIHPTHYPLAVISLVSLAIKVLLFIVEAGEKQKYLKLEYKSSSTEAKSGILSRSVYLWLNKLLFSGFRGNLSLPDIFALDENLSSKPLIARFDQQWKRDTGKHRKKLALVRSLICDLRWTIVAAAVPRLCLIGFKFAQPFFIDKLIQFVSSEGHSELSGAKYGLLGAAALIYIGLAVSNALYKSHAIRMVTMIRGCLVGMIYTETLQQVSEAGHEASSVTLMGTDVDRIVAGILNAHELWASSIEIVIALALLINTIGYPAVAALVFAFISVSGSSYIAPAMRQRQRAWIHAVQNRVNLTSAILKSLRQVKMFGIELDITSKIHHLRQVELDSSKPYRSLIVSVNVLGVLATSLAPAATITVYAVARLNLKAETPKADLVFTSLSLISLLTSSVVLLSVSLTRFTSAIGCFDRVQEFLLQEKLAKPQSHIHMQMEVEPIAGIELTSTPTRSQFLVRMDGCSFSLRMETPTLLDSLTLKIPHSSVSAVTGPLGCGKSSLLKAILGELHCRQGRLLVTASRLAYCQQTPCIFNGTFRTNIVGESTIDEKWLQQVVSACDLAVDVTRLPDGLDTVVGSSGSQLSGGQKHRLALARAIYSRPDLLLLDDVFSALDTVTAKRVFRQLFGRAGLVKKLGLTTIFTTASVGCLREADIVIVLSHDGSMEAQGPFEAIIKQNEFMQGLSSQTESDNEEEEEEEAELEDDATARGIPTDQASSQPKPTKETTPRGNGDISLYGYYIQSFGWWPFGFVLASAVLFVLCLIFPQILLSWWSSSSAKQNYYYLGSYIGISVAATAAIGIYIGFFFVWAVPKSAIKLHRLLLDVVMRAPWPRLAQLDRGSLINRFSQDMSLVDMQLPVAFGVALQNFLTCIAQGGLIAAGAGYMSIVIPFCIGAVYMIQTFYLRTSRQIRLLDLEAKAPLYAHFLETIEGAITVRAFQWQNRFADRNAQLLDISQKPFYAMYCIQQWLQVVLDLLVAALAIVLTSLSVFITSKTSSGAVGVALVNLLSFNATLALLVTNWTQLETSLGAISRTKQFVTDRTLQPSPRRELVPARGWSSRGRLEFRELSASYGADNTPVLKKVSFSVGSGQKLGICGRTGSGKSSLIASLFSLITVTSGTICIDDMDISTIPRDKLHSAIVPIPQHPLIIPGTIRENLSLGMTWSIDDATIISVLESVQLWERIREQGGLDTDINSIHLSDGHQQLLSIARALLLPGGLVVLDEPTSGFDEHTEKIVQGLIREKFRGRTIVSVAHRIGTIMDSDMILVMDHGEICEMGTPEELLSRKGQFWKLYQTPA